MHVLACRAQRETKTKIKTDWFLISQLPTGGPFFEISEVLGLVPQKTREIWQKKDSF
jgi:hypothetical protein